jgi:quercetin dioxygenase-like cupin family protein
MLSTIGEVIMSLVSHADNRRTETPAGVMTTLASPTLGGAESSIWRVEMAAGKSGPAHVFDVEQVWTVLDGGATVELAGEPLVIGPGDTVVMPAAAPRQVTADPDQGFAAIVTAPAGARASLTDGTDKGVPPWIA